jgi:ATP-dependent RNA helicase RhlE
MNFESFNLHPRIEAGIRNLDYTTATPIQEQAIPPILQNRDIIGQAQTGTGKTAAFVLPILHRLMEGPRKHIRALILAPTRELAEQTHKAIMQMGSHTKLKSVTIYGGVKQNAQLGRLRSGAEIVVACPGRLIDLMDQGEMDLTRIEVLVIDEADRMFDMGFLPDLRTILDRLPGQRQTLLFSATMPDDVRALAERIMHDPVTIQVDDAVPVSTVSHAIYPVEEHLKTALLMKILESAEMPSVLVFTRTKVRADRLTKQLKKAGLLAATLHGDLSQDKREKALNGFRTGRHRVLVATDIAARGIDISQISHVINYDMPDTVDAYTHRIGRTGRALHTGDAFTFVTREDRAFVWDIEKVLGEPLERRILEDFDYLAPVPETDAAADRPRRSRNQPGVRKNSRRAPAGGARAHSASPSRPAPAMRRGRRDLSGFPFSAGSSD